MFSVGGKIRYGCGLAKALNDATTPFVCLLGVKRESGTENVIRFGDAPLRLSGITSARRDISDNISPPGYQ